MKSANEMMNEIGAWADKCFPVHLPDYGIAEEIGEIMHCILKRAQKIREMDKDEKFYPALKDAFADVTIYLLHLCYMRKVALSFEMHYVETRPTSDRLFLANALRNAAQLTEYMEIVEVSDNNPMFRVPAQTLMNVLVRWGRKWEIDVVQCARDEWATNVSKREWDKNRDSADLDVPKA